jgi:hypothetical protein
MAVSVLPPPPVALPHLENDSAESCPVRTAELRTHLAALVGEVRERAVSLRFVRTARIGEMKYWLWSVRSRGGHAYATVLVEPDGSAWIRLHATEAELAPEALLLEDYRSAFEP